MSLVDWNRVGKISKSLSRKTGDRSINKEAKGSPCWFLWLAFRIHISILIAFNSDPHTKISKNFTCWHFDHENENEAHCSMIKNVLFITWVRLYSALPCAHNVNNKHSTSSIQMWNEVMRPPRLILCSASFALLFLLWFNQIYNSTFQWDWCVYLPWKVQIEKLSFLKSHHSNSSSFNSVTEFVHS